MSPTTLPSGSAQHWGPLWGARPNEWAQIEEQQTPTYEEVIQRVGIKPAQRVLDIGCGAGTFLRLVASRGAQVYGLDASESLLKLARTRLPDADLRNGDMQLLPYEDNYFDVVTGFNSFFFAADMVAALREAGRVAKPGSPVVIFVWGRPENCSLDGMKRAVAALLAAPKPDTPPPKLWEPGVLEELASHAGLSPEKRFETTSAFEYPNTEAFVQSTLSPGIIVQAVQVAGEEAVRTTIVEAVAPYQRPDGSYRLQNEWHYLVARAH